METHFTILLAPNQSHRQFLNRAESISTSVRKYGSQVIAMCHHPARSPKAMIPSPTTPMAAPPAKAPTMRAAATTEGWDHTFRQSGAAGLIDDIEGSENSWMLWASVVIAI